MTVFEEHAVRSRYCSAREALRGVVESMALGGRRPALRLRVGADGTAAIVLVKFAQAEEPTHFDDMWHIEWRAEHDKTFPGFEGTLSLRYVEDGSAKLEMRGQFVPRAALGGKGFDLVAGRRIAARTCRDVLADLAARIKTATTPLG